MPSNAASSACPMSVSPRSSTRLPARKSPQKTIRSARSTRMSVLCRCRIRGLLSLRRLRSPKRSCRRPLSLLILPGSSPAHRRRSLGKSVPFAHPRSGCDRTRRARLRQHGHRPCDRTHRSLSDIDIIDTELALADLTTLEKGLDRAAKLRKAARRTCCGRRRSSSASNMSSTQAVRCAIATQRRRAARSARPASVDGKARHVRGQRRGKRLQQQSYLISIEERARAEGTVAVAICAAIEAEIAQLDEADRTEFLAELGLTEPGLNRVIRAAYKLLGLQTYFTAGPKEVRAWTVRSGATAPQAAGVIHTDFEHGFIGPR